MSIIFSRGEDDIKWPEKHNAASEKIYLVTYRPPAWTANTNYVDEENAVCPTVANGCIYTCTSGGKSGATEPTWGTVEGETTVDGGVEWLCKADTCTLRPGDSITASSWSGTGCTVSNDTFAGGLSTQFKLTAVPASAQSVKMTNTFTITRANTDTETRHKSIIIKVVQ